MTQTVVLLPGDGVGPSVIDAARRVVEAAGADVEWEVHQVGVPAVEAGQPALPAHVLDRIRMSGVALKGPVSTPRGAGFRSVNLSLRDELGLFLQVRRCRSFAGVPASAGSADLYVVRETTEDLYAGVEMAPDSEAGRELVRWLQDRGARVATGAALGIKPVSEQATRRAAAFLARYISGSDRRRVTLAHKATVMRQTDGLFVAAARDELGRAGVEVDDMLVDAVAASVVREPGRFDVIFTLNLYADILTDVAGAVLGGIGLVPGVNLGDAGAVFEPAHGTVPSRAGLDMVNPTATVLSAAWLLAHIGQTDAAARIEAAVEDVLAEGSAVTYDVAGPVGREPVGTAAMAAAITARLR